MFKFRDWYKKRHTEVFTEGEEPIIYKGFRIEKYNGVNVGYAGPFNSKRSRKTDGFLIYYPDSDGTKFVPTLRAAKQYIDEYVGDNG